MRRTLAVLFAAGLMLAACKSTADGASSTDDTAAPSTELGVGVSADTIRVGVMTYDYSALKDILPSLDHGEYESAFEALATSINDAGGIGGRSVELSFATMDPIDQSTVTTPCTKLTEDEQVFAVLVPQVNATGALCVLDDHASPLVGGVQTEDVLATAKAPWFTWDATAASAAEKTVAAVLDDDALDGQKVAVVSSAANQKVADAVAQQLRDGGVEVTGAAVGSANLTDTTAVRAEMQTFAERFRSDGAQTVVVVGDAFVPFAQGLQVTDYRPKLVSTSTANVRGYLVSATDFSVLGGLVAGGPPDEVTAFEEPPAQDCIDRVKAVQPDREIATPDSASARTPDTYVSVVQACKAMNLFQAIADNAGDTLNADTFRSAGYGLGEIELPMLGGPSDYSEDHADGDPPLFLAKWDDAAQTLVYSSTPMS